MVVIRFRYFPRRWEDLAHGAIIENLRSARSRYIQVVPFLLAEAWAVRRAVRSFRPDIVHVHWLVPQGVVTSACAPRVPSVVTTLGGDLYALDGPPWRVLKRWVVSRAAAVTVMNEQMRAAVRDLGAAPQDVHVLPMGVDASAFAGPRRGRQRGLLRLLFVGRLVEKKGLAVLLDALAQCSVDARLTVVGDGPLRSSLEDRASELPVTFVGQQGRSRLAELYLEHDVVVTPSVRAASGDQDGLPVALLEAMASGCAIVASDLPGINEAVVDGTSGLLVPAGDAVLLRSALERLSHDQTLLDALGSGARSRAAAFSVERRGEEYAALLRSVLAAAPERSEDDGRWRRPRSGRRLLGLPRH
jgi:glycosyltransferase involved in cell wall biosynthesis